MGDEAAWTDIPPTRVEGRARTAYPLRIHFYACRLWWTYALLKLHSPLAGNARRGMNATAAYPRTTGSVHLRATTARYHAIYTHPPLPLPTHWCGESIASICSGCGGYDYLRRHAVGGLDVGRPHAPAFYFTFCYHCAVPSTHPAGTCPATLPAFHCSPACTRAAGTGFCVAIPRLLLPRHLRLRGFSPTPRRLSCCTARTVWAWL